MTPESFQNLLQKYLRGECSPDEKKLIDDWYHNIGETDVQIPEDMEDRMLSQLRSRNNLGENHTTRLVFRIAASLLVICLFGYIAYRSVASLGVTSETISALEREPSEPETARLITVENSGPGTRTLNLADGSTVVLKPKSSLSYPANFTDGTRAVELVGEAFFDIRRDSLRPFMVYTREVITKVLGTSFTIRAFDADPSITVSVKTGRVSVYTNPEIISTPEQSSVLVTPNQQAVYDRAELIVSKELVEKPEITLPTPTLFKMQYDGAPVTRIFEVLEENYGIEIEFDEMILRDCVLTTRMAEEGLFERVKVICKAINARYTVEDAVIKIESDGCR